jgi:hypothetical protein
MKISRRVNPGGKTPEFAECHRRCRERSPEAADRIWELAQTTKDERLAFMAYTRTYERAWGKARDIDPKDAASEKPKFDPRLYSARSWRSSGLPWN